MRCKLGDISEITKLAGYEFTKYVRYIPDGEIIAVRALNLKNGTLVLDDIQRISKEVSETLPRSQLHKNDIVLSYTGTLGECAQIQEEGKYHLAPNVCKITPNGSVVNPNFLFQYIRCDSFKQTLINYAHGSTQPTIPMSTIRDIPVVIPDDFEKQGKIAAILSALDEKIAINRAINDNLLAQAQTLYKQFFPYGVQDDLPDGWRIGTVGEIIEIHDSKRIPLSGADRSKMEKKIYPYYGAASLMDLVDNYIFDGKYLLLGEDGTVVDDAGYPILQYVWGQFWVNNHAHILTGRLGYDVESLYMLFKQTPVKSIVTGAVQPKISQANLRSVQVVIPPEHNLREYNDLVEPLFSLFRANEEECKTFTALRDTLLPKLMSGEIDVSAVQL